MTPEPDVTLDDLVEQYGHLREQAGRLFADISHRMRMMGLVLTPGQMIGPMSPVEAPAAKPRVRPVARAAAPGPGRPGARRLVVEVLRDAGVAVPLAEIFERVGKRGYHGKMDSVRIAAWQLTKEGAIVGSPVGYDLPPDSDRLLAPTGTDE